MKTLPIYPSLLQINTRVWLGELARPPGHPGSLDDIPESSLDEIARLGFDYAWLLGVWQTGEEGRQAALNSPGLMRECGAALPDYISQDVSGSPFAITDYRVHADLGGVGAKPIPIPSHTRGPMSHRSLATPSRRGRMRRWLSFPVESSSSGWPTIL